MTGVQTCALPIYRGWKIPGTKIHKDGTKILKEFLKVFQDWEERGLFYDKLLIQYDQDMQLQFTLVVSGFGSKVSKSEIISVLSERGLCEVSVFSILTDKALILIKEA